MGRWMGWCSWKQDKDGSKTWSEESAIQIEEVKC